MDLYCIQLESPYSPYLTFDHSAKVMHVGANRMMEGYTWPVQLDEDVVSRTVVHVPRTEGHYGARSSDTGIQDTVQALLDSYVGQVQQEYSLVFGQDPALVLISVPPKAVTVNHLKSSMAVYQFSLAIGVTALSAKPQELGEAKPMASLPELPVVSS